MRKALMLPDIYNLSMLQCLQDAAAQATNVAAVIVGPTGHPVTRPSNQVGLCGVFSRCAETAPICRRSVRSAVTRCRTSGRMESTQCPLTGLEMVSLPIVVEGTFLGAWLFEQLRTQDPSEEKMHEIAQTLGITPRSAMWLLSRIPCKSAAEHEAALAVCQAVHTLTLALASAKPRSIKRHFPEHEAGHRTLHALTTEN